jgi:glucosamine--fructose-6-phosphate aminotransferase (isomerizing)
MCGIIAFLGYASGIKQLYEGLLILQNRGYDSAGICSIINKHFLLHKFASNEKTAFEYLEPYVSTHSESMNIVGHSRWSTTGSAGMDCNSHPHIDYTNKFSVVHNGIIENYAQLKVELQEKGVTFKSETDTEVIVNLIGYNYAQGNTARKSIDKALARLEGTWGVVIQCIDTPDKLFCARHGSPLLIGFGENYVMLASEQSGFSRYINNYISLNNHDIIELKKINGKIEFQRMDDYDLWKVTVQNNALTPEPYPHWTLKEINEQVDASIRAMGMGGRIQDNKTIKLGGLHSNITDLINIDNLIILGCGTSYHAGLYSLRLFKQISGFNMVNIFDGSEFDKYDIPKNGKTGIILLSQSGETKDLHRCIEVAKDNNLMMIGVVNVVDSMIARDVHCGVYLNAGKEVGVASTKSFTSQAIVLNLIACWFGQNRHINEVKRMELIQGLRTLPYDIKRVIDETTEHCIEVAKYLINHDSIFLLGRGQNEAIAMEGGLKIKEIAYVNSNGYSTASLKHGSYALLVEGFPIIILLPDDSMFARNNSVGDELQSRNAFMVAITDRNIGDKYNIKIKIPKNKPFFGLLANICLQLIAYHLGVLKGNNVDKPRNLAKCVTTD